MAYNKTYKKHLLTFIVALCGLLTITATVNIFFDPLMCLRTIHASNRIAPVIDSRLQKTNRLLHGGETYDALLIGSSRVEQFRQIDFAPLKVFNYSVSSFYPDEAEEYINLFLRVNGRKPTVVFLGLDFYGSNLRAHEHAKPPRYYLETCSSHLYPIRSALSRDTLKYSYIMARGKRQLFMYDRSTLDKITNLLSPQESDDYAATLHRLKAAHPELLFVVFTTPITKDLFNMLVKTGRLPDYDRWLKDIVDVFGSVYNFMIIDRLTLERRNFLDAHHLYPERTAPLARIITGHPMPQDEEIGHHITRGIFREELEKAHASWTLLNVSK